jgi:hypothetical protein
VTRRFNASEGKNAGEGRIRVRGLLLTFSIHRPDAATGFGRANPAIKFRTWLVRECTAAALLALHRDENTVVAATCPARVRQSFKRLEN